MGAEITWICEVCGAERPDRAISVHTRDITAELGLANIIVRGGSVKRNVRHCNDRPDCVAGAVALSEKKALGFSFANRPRTGNS